MAPGGGVKPKCLENRVKLTLSGWQKDAKPGALSEKALDLHRNKDYFKRWMQRSATWLAKPPLIRVCQNVLPTDKAWK